eukprot:5151391-Prymnesium_polylepis.6
MTFIPYSTGLQGGGNLNAEQIQGMIDNTLSVPLDVESEPPLFIMYYNVDAIITTQNSKTVSLYFGSSIGGGTYPYTLGGDIHLSGMPTVNGIPGSALDGRRTVLSISGPPDFNAITIDADSAATSSGTIFISATPYPIMSVPPTLSNMQNGDIRFYVVESSGVKQVNVRYRVGDVDYHGLVTTLT